MIFNSYNLILDNWELEIENWQLEIENWQLEIKTFLLPKLRYIRYTIRCRTSFTQKVF